MTMMLLLMKADRGMLVADFEDDGKAGPGLNCSSCENPGKTVKVKASIMDVTRNSSMNLAIEVLSAEIPHSSESW